MAEKIKLEVEVDASQGVKAGDDLKKSIDGATESTEELSGHLDSMTGGAVSGFTRIVSGVKNGVRAFGTLKGAIAATGIGALLLAFGSLTAFFTRTEKGAQTLRVIMAALGAVVDNIADKFANLGEAMVHALTEGNKAAEGSGNAFKRFFSGLKNQILINSGFFNLLASDIAKISIEAGRLAQTMNTIKVQQRELSVAQARSRAEIKELNKDAEDVTLSLGEREEAARKAIALEETLMNRRLNLQRQYVQTLGRQQELGESTEADLQEMAQAQIELANITMESQELQTTLQNKLNILRAEGIRLLREEKEAKAQAARDAFAAQKEQDKLFLEESKALRQVEADEEISFITEQEQRKLAVRTDFGEKYVLQEEEFMKKRVRMTQEDALNSLNVAEGMLNSLAQLNAGAEANTESEKRKQFKRGQKLAIAQALIDTSRAALAAFVSAAQIPLIGPVAAPIAAAGATAFGLVRVNQIKKQKYSGGGGAASAGSSASFSPPTAPTQTNAARGIDIDTENLGADTGKITKTYVLSKDVSSKQELDAAIKRESVI